MRRKLLAMGNLLMGDDAIAIYLASALEGELSQLGIEVIYGETDIGYSMTRISEEDFVIFADAADFGGIPGEVKEFQLDDMVKETNDITEHNIRFLDLIKLHMPKLEGAVLAVQIADIHFRYGLSEELLSRFSVSKGELMHHINKLM
jgi:hydrogenase maturation protease